MEDNQFKYTEACILPLDKLPEDVYHKLVKPILSRAGYDIHIVDFKWHYAVNKFEEKPDESFKGYIINGYDEDALLNNVGAHIDATGILEVMHLREQVWDEMLAEKPHVRVADNYIEFIQLCMLNNSNIPMVGQLVLIDMWKYAVVIGKSLDTTNPKLICKSYNGKVQEFDINNNDLSTLTPETIKITSEQSSAKIEAFMMESLATKTTKSWEELAPIKEIIEATNQEITSEQTTSLEDRLISAETAKRIVSHLVEMGERNFAERLSIDWGVPVLLGDDVVLKGDHTQSINGFANSSPDLKELLEDLYLKFAFGEYVVNKNTSEIYQLTGGVGAGVGLRKLYTNERFSTNIESLNQNFQKFNPNTNYLEAPLLMVHAGHSMELLYQVHGKLYRYIDGNYKLAANISPYAYIIPMDAYDITWSKLKHNLFSDKTPNDDQICSMDLLY